MSITLDQWVDIGGKVLTLAGITIGAFWTSHKVNQVHVSVNSRMDQMLAQKDAEREAAVAAATAVAHAVGLQQGQAQATRSIEELKK